VVLTDAGEVWTWGEPWGEFAMDIQRAPKKVRDTECEGTLGPTCLPCTVQQPTPGLAAEPHHGHPNRSPAHLTLHHYHTKSPGAPPHTDQLKPDTTPNTPLP